MKNRFSVIPALVAAAVLALPLTIQAAPATNAAATTQQQTTTVNINQATAEELAAKLQGIGMSKAVAIVEYRKKVGKFVSVDQLAEVKGIGKATIDQNRPNIKLN